MTTTSKILAATAALGIIGFVGTAAAAPLGALTDAGSALKAGASDAGAAEQVNYRCQWYRGQRHCGAPRVYSYYYAPRRTYGRPYYYGGYGVPSFSFSLGGYRRWW